MTELFCPISYERDTAAYVLTDLQDVIDRLAMVHLTESQAQDAIDALHAGITIVDPKEIHHAPRWSFMPA